MDNNLIQIQWNKHNFSFIKLTYYIENRIIVFNESNLYVLDILYFIVERTYILANYPISETILGLFFRKFDGLLVSFTVLILTKELKIVLVLFVKLSILSMVLIFNETRSILDINLIKFIRLSDHFRVFGSLWKGLLFKLFP